MSENAKSKSKASDATKAAIRDARARGWARVREAVAKARERCERAVRAKCTEHLNAEVAQQFLRIDALRRENARLTRLLERAELALWRETARANHHRERARRERAARRRQAAQLGELVVEGTALRGEAEVARRLDEIRRAT